MQNQCLGKSHISIEKLKSFREEDVGLVEDVLFSADISCLERVSGLTAARLCSGAAQRFREPR